MRSPAVLLAMLCLPVALGGCALSRSQTATNSKIPKGTPPQIGVVINDLASDADGLNSTTICNSVLSSALAAKLNAGGGCTKAVGGQLKTIDDFTLTIEGVKWNSRTATAAVQTIVNGKHQTQTLDLVNQQHGGWRINSLG